MKNPNAVLALLSLVSFLFAPPVFSQSELSSAHVTGTLTDPSGASVSGARIIAKSERNSTSFGPTESSTDGSYRLDLPPGRFRVSITKDSFISREAAITLQPGETVTLNLRLELAPMSSSVLVTGQIAPTIQEQSPAPSSILTNEEITQRQAITLPDLLYTQPGISIARTGPIGGLTTLFLDGGNSNYTKVFIDGTPANEPGGNFDFSNLSLDNIDKVEVVHGAESALYGSDAMSGVIQLFSHRGSTEVPSFDLYSEGGNLSSARGGGQVSGALGHFDYSGAGSYLTTDGQGPNDAFINRTFAGNFGYSFSDTDQLRVTVRSNSSWAQIPGPTLLEPPTVGQYYAYQDLTTNLSWTFNTGSQWQHRLAGWDSRIVDANYIPGDGPAFVDQYNTAGFNEQSNYSFTKGLIALGYQYYVENGYPSGIVGGTHARRNNQAGFVNGRWFPVHRVVLSAGFRVEDNTTFGIRTVPSAGAVYAARYGKGFWGGTNLRFSYGEGIKEPALEQSFGSDPCYPGNPNLKPEESQTFNATIDQFLMSDRAHVSVSFFASRFTDIISYAPNPQPNPNYCGTYFNTDLARARGLNLSTELRMKKWLSVNGYYTYDATRVLEAGEAGVDPAYNVGEPLLRRPLKSGSILLNALWARVNWNFIGYFSGIRTDVNFFTLEPANNPGYARFDMAASYNLTHSLALTSRVWNLFDKQYQDALGYPALGRTYTFGMRYSFAGRN
ncbi:MAG: TonB-dependent receptor [Candidatus Acidiferrum sp.]